MRRLVLAAVLIAAPVLRADVMQKVREGVVLFDSGRVDEAIVKYKEAVAEDPKNVLAAYELALAYASKNDYANCRSVLEPVARIADPAQVIVLTMLGNCHDAAGNRAKAIDAYRRALAIAPDNPSVNYELGIALEAAGKYAEARDALKIDTRARPGHASGRRALGFAFSKEGFRAAALMEYLHFLALEPSSQRSSEVTKEVRDLIHAGITEKDSHNIELKVDPEPRTEEGDYSGFLMGISIVGASRFTDDAVKKNDFERFRDQIASVINIFIESVEVTRRDYTAQAHVPFFSAMNKAKLIDTFAGIVILSQKLDGTEAWAQKNQAEIRRFGAWAAPYRNARPLVEMPVPTP